MRGSRLLKVATLVVLGCRGAPQAETLPDSAADPPSVPPIAVPSPPDTLDRLLADLARKLAPIDEWRAATVVMLRADSGTTRADSIAFQRRSELKRMVRELTRPFSDTAFQRILLDKYGAQVNSTMSDSVIAFLGARGVWPAYGEGDFYFFAREASILEWLGRYVTYGFREFLQLATVDQERPLGADAAIIISLDELAARIVRIEEVLHTYPESPARDHLRFRFNQYIAAYIGGSDNTPAFDRKTRLMHPALRSSLQKFAVEHGAKESGAIVKDYVTLLELDKYHRSAKTDAFLRARWDLLRTPARDVY